MESRSHFKSRWLKLSKHGRRFKPSVLVVVAVALCASVLVPLAGDPPLLDEKLAAAHPFPGCGGSGWLHEMCESAAACRAEGGTPRGYFCDYYLPTTTTTTTTTAPTTTSRPVGPVTATCHRHGSHFVNNECHSHPTNKACGETVWVHTGDLSNLHTTYTVTTSPPCTPPLCPTGQHRVNGACEPRCPASQKWVLIPWPSCVSRCIASKRWVNGACEARCAASQKWVPPSGGGVNGACKPRCAANERWVDTGDRTYCKYRCPVGPDYMWLPPSGTSSGFCQGPCPDGQHGAPFPPLWAQPRPRNKLQTFVTVFHSVPDPPGRPTAPVTKWEKVNDISVVVAGNVVVIRGCYKSLRVNVGWGLVEGL